MDIKLIKNFRNLFLWQVLNRGLSIIYFTILTINLGPYNYGILALVLAIYEVASVGFIGVNNALQRYIPERRQWDVLSGSLKLSLIFSLVFSVFLFLFRGYISDLLNQNLSYFILVLIFVLFVSAIREVLSNALFGLKEFGSFIVVEFAYNVSKIAIVTFFLYLSMGIAGILYGLVFSAIVSIFVAFFLIRKVSFSKKLFNRKKLFDYSIKFVFISFIYQLQPQIFIFFLGKFSSVLDVGYYKFLLNLVLIFIVMLPQTLSFIIFPYISELIYKGSREELQKLFNTSFKLAFYMAFIASVVFYFLIGFIVRFFFEEYIPSLKYVLFFLFFGIIQSVGFISATLMKATDSLVYYIKLTVIVLIFSLFITPVFINFFGVGGAILSYAVVFLFITIFLTFNMARKLGITLSLIPSKSDFDLFRKLIKGFIKF